MKKDRIVIIPEHVKKVFDEASAEDKEKLEEAFQRLADGEILGERVSCEPIKEKLLCNYCGSQNISWNRIVAESDAEDEIMFRCYDCGEHGWMYDHEYEEAKQNYPECIFT